MKNPLKNSYAAKIIVTASVFLLWAGALSAAVGLFGCATPSHSSESMFVLPRLTEVAGHPEKSQWSGIYRVFAHGRFQGTAFRIDEHYAATAAHVIRGSNSNDFTLDDAAADLVMLNDSADVALFRSEALTGKTYTFAGADFLQRAFCVSYVGADGFGWPIVTSGRVSSPQVAGHIWFDGGVQPGMSGGPVFNDNGGVLGLVHSATYWFESQSAMGVNSVMGQIVSKGPIETMLSVARDVNPPRMILVLPPINTITVTITDGVECPIPMPKISTNKVTE